MRSALRELVWISLGIALVISLGAASSAEGNAQTVADLIDTNIVSDNPQLNRLLNELKKEGAQSTSLVDERFLFASLLWGSVGMGYLLYARRQRMITPFIGGLAMIGISYFVGSWLWMSLLCTALIVAVYQATRWGY